MDVTSDKDIADAYETVINSITESEQLFGLVNNAGIARPAEFEWGTDISDGKRVIDVNLMGLMSVTLKFLPLIRQATGRIVNVESGAAIVPIQFGTFYGPSKYGANGFRKNLRIEMFKFGVSVVSILPFFYKTPIINPKILADCFEASYLNSSEEVRRSYGSNYMKRGQRFMHLLRYAPKYSRVPEIVVSALTVHEPDPTYIAAPLLLKPFLKVMTLASNETLNVVYYQFIWWLLGLHKAYPDNPGEQKNSNVEA